MRSVLLCAVLASGLAGAAEAGQVLTFAITDIGTFPNYISQDTSIIYPGTGFLGEYSGSFVHIFGLEGPTSKTDLQVDVADLAGQAISSAVLSFALQNHFNTLPGTLTATSYDSAGDLAYNFDNTRASLGTATGVIQGATAQVDVTGLLRSAVAAGQSYFALHLENSQTGDWTVTYPAYGGTPDSADVRLTVTTADAIATPEPPTWIGGTFAALAGIGWQWRRRRAA